MRKIIKGITAVLLFSLVFSLAGCGNKSDATTEKETEATTEATTEASSEEKKTETTITGVIEEVKGDLIQVKESNGNSYWFNLKGADLELKNGMHAGNIVTVTYTGDVETDGSENCHVLQLVDNDENVKKEVKKHEKKAKTIKIVKKNDTRYAKLPLNVRDNPGMHGKKIGYLKQGEAVKRTGECANGWARIEFKGKTAYCYGADLSAKKVKKAVSTTAKKKSTTTEKKKKTSGAKKATTAKKKKTTTAKKKPTTTAEPKPTQPTTKTIQAVVVDATMNNLCIKYNGQQYNVYIGHAKITSVNGILIGNTVTVKYQGSLSNNPTIISVDDQDKNQETKQSAPSVDDTSAVETTTAQEDSE